MDHALSGVVGAEEEAAFRVGQGMDVPRAALKATDPGPDESPPPDLNTLLLWLKEGKRDQVLKHIGRLSAELQPLVDLMLQQGKR